MAQLSRTNHFMNRAQYLLVMLPGALDKSYNRIKEGFRRLKIAVDALELVSVQASSLQLPGR